MNSFNIKFPFYDDNINNKFVQTNLVSKNGLSSNLLLLLVTNKGERLYQPNYGTNLLKYIFEPMDSLTEKDIETEIKQTVKLYMPELTIDSVSFYDNTNDDYKDLSDNEIQVVVDFTYNEATYSDNGQLSITF